MAGGESPSVRAFAAGLILAAAGCAGFAALAQPDPSFWARCEMLRDSLSRLGAVGDAYFTIQVVDRLE